MSILVIDTETTGLEGYPKDRVLEIGIAELADDGAVIPIYNSLIRYDDIVEFDRDYITTKDGSKGCWIYRNSSMSLEDTLNAEKDLATVVAEVRAIVNGRKVTSYNMPFDFERFLNHEPWNIRDCSVLYKDIMDMATAEVYALADADRIKDKALQHYLIEKRSTSRHAVCWVRSNDAYHVLCPDDPAHLGSQTHRALDDAVMEAHILSVLAKRVRRRKVHERQKTIDSHIPDPCRGRFLDYLCNKNLWLETYHRLSETYPGKTVPTPFAEGSTFLNGMTFEEVITSLKDGSYEFGVPRAKIVRIGAKSRTVFMYPDKVSNSDTYVLRIMNTFLMRRYDHLFPANLYSFRPGTGVQDAIDYLKKQNSERGMMDVRFGYKADVSKYFHAVDREKLLRDLEHTIAPTAAYYLRKFLNTADSIRPCEGYDPPGIFPGLPVSMFLSNFYLRKLDQHFLDKGVTYCRFADDILVFGDTKDDLDSHARYIRRFITRKGLDINPSKEKFYPGSEKLEFLGLVYECGIFDLNRKSFMRRKDKIREICNDCRKHMEDVLGEFVKNPKRPTLREFKGIMDGSISGLKVTETCKLTSGKPIPIIDDCARKLIRSLNRQYYAGFEDGEMSFMKWYRGMIGTAETMERIDQFCLQEIRYALCGRRGEAAVRMVPYSYLKKMGYKSLVSVYYHGELL